MRRQPLQEKNKFKAPIISVVTFFTRGQLDFKEILLGAGIMFALDFLIQKSTK